MSNSGTGYFLGLFSFNSPSGSGTKTSMGGVVWGPIQAWHHQAVLARTDHGLTGTSTFFYI